MRTALFGAHGVNPTTFLVLKLEQLRVRAETGAEPLLLQADQRLEPRKVVGEKAGGAVNQRQPQQRPRHFAPNLGFTQRGFGGFGL